MSKVTRPRPKRRFDKRPPVTRRTASEKAKLLELLDRDSVSGMSVEEIAAKHGISTASYYRWQRQRLGIERSVFKELSIDLNSVEKSIIDLCSIGELSQILKVDAIFQLITWMRWPSESEFYAPAMINCLTSYLIKKRSSHNISDLSVEEREVLLKYLNMNIAFHLSSPSTILNPSFELVTDGRSRYDDRQFYAQIINYLLSGSISIGRKLHHPSLDGLEYLVNEKAFGKSWSMSPRTFNKRWRLRAASSPFLYVEQYHSPFDWSINPLDEDFAQNVDEIIEQSAALRDYLGKVKWVIFELQSILDPRATRHIAFPQMPASLDSVPVVNPRIDSRLHGEISILF